MNKCRAMDVCIVVVTEVVGKVDEIRSRQGCTCFTTLCLLHDGPYAFLGCFVR